MERSLIFEDLLPQQPPEKLENLLCELSSEFQAKRIETIKRVISKRVANLCILSDRIMDPGNSNAMVRTAEALGIFQFADIPFEGKIIKKANRPSKGATKWILRKRFEQPKDAIEYFKTKGVSIYASSLHGESAPIHELDFTKKAVFVFGNEAEGVGNELLEASDKIFHLPMRGFTESFNVSVACALTFSVLYWNSQKLKFLSNLDQKRLLLHHLEKLTKERGQSHR